MEEKPTIQPGQFKKRRLVAWMAFLYMLAIIPFMGWLFAADVINALFPLAATIVGACAVIVLAYMGLSTYDDHSTRKAIASVTQRG